MPGRLECAICVLGAGPAGAAISRRLSQLGHSVILLEKAPFPRAHVGESLTGGILPLVDALGLRECLENAGFYRPARALVRWAGRPEHDVQHSGERGFQVDRGRFDRILADAAVEAGTTLLQPVRVAAIRRTDRGWRVDASLQDQPISIDSAFLVDSTGRTNLLRGRCTLCSEPLLAVSAYWRNDPASGFETRVESSTTEWFWGAPLPDGSFNATVFVDPKMYRAFPPSLYESLLNRSTLLSDCTRGQRLTEVSVCDATSYIAEDLASKDSIKIGEAAFTIDPLSSQGVQTAIGSALHASTVLNTIVRRPCNVDAALDFYRNRQRASAELHRAAAAGFYADAADYYQTDFWIRRGAGNRVPAPGTRAAPDLPAPDTVVHLSPALKATTVACIRGDYIAELRGFAHPALRVPLVFIGDVAVAELLESVSYPTAARNLVQGWTPLVPAESGFEILCQLWAAGVLCSGRSG
jgi:flavin-dependent dehydrogenase